MMPAHPPAAGLLSKVSDWFSDVLAMPRRIKRLAHGAEFDRDPRPQCRSCGAGRVGDLRPTSDPAMAGVGSCNHCGALFAVDHKGAIGRVMKRDVA